MKTAAAHIFYGRNPVSEMFISLLFTEEQAEFDPQTVRPGSRYSHVQEVQERLNFLRCVGNKILTMIEGRGDNSCLFGRFLLKDGQLWLCAPQAKQIWKCLAENAVFLCDREACFKWYQCFTKSYSNLTVKTR